jgi:ribosomal protein S1
MSTTDITGKIAFINHEKKYVMIEYEQHGKKKTVKGSIDTSNQKGGNKKGHHFLMGDMVTFTHRMSDRGDRMIATDIQFLYNNALDVLINKAAIQNKFTGYLKAADDGYFVKEIESYLFFPVYFSPWHIIPTEEELNEPVYFSLENLEKKEKISAALFNNEYIPAFHTAVKLSKSKSVIDATVTNITAHGIYVNLVDDVITSKIALDKNPEAAALAVTLKVGDTIKVVITHIGKSRIIVAIAKEESAV